MLNSIPRLKVEVKWKLSIPILLLLAGPCMGQTNDRTIREKKEPQPQIGRYQLYVPPEHVGLAILLDTATGKTWHQVQYEQLVGEPSVWVPTAERVNSQTELEAWIAKQTVKPKQGER